ncbi:MAG: acetylglutamate kinase [Nitrospirae bacterium]|nr:acetylglutamate kinase [Candidatus Troglogloeales bacterium]MBI3598282.1 acetylglutamate kinase [Candidatus Troglogloeales bacterium]
MNNLHLRAKILVEALPYIRAFFGKTVVIKYGGAAMSDTALKGSMASDVVLMKYVGINPIVVHGGGPQISGMMKRLGKEVKFVKGMRVTDSETMEIVEMVLGGTLNKEIVNLINQHGGRGVGLSGKDGGLIRAKPVKGVREETCHVGDVAEIDPRILQRLEGGTATAGGGAGGGEGVRFIPVISPVGADEKGKSYNINADLVAAHIAVSLSAEKLLILTDVPGILDKKGQLIPTLSRKEVFRMVKKEEIRGGMLPKVEAALLAVDSGVRKAHIIDGRVPHALLLEVLTDQGVGTEIVS